MLKNLHYFVGVQNDAVYIITGKRPALNNDFPDHDAPRDAVAHVYAQDDTARQIAHACNYHDAQRNMLHEMGDAVVGVLEQLVKGKWVDQEGRHVVNNKQLRDLAAAMSKNTELCEKITAAMK